eukprot:TRINITY_DN34741_c0_g1_i3.p1 TRINITY_DN34741_c0_g1~~TRINITY_DN34741_c0_g1_i3.p1  ORF type:complete len:482 (+),score=65.03 TRINITY_DN34741_c0_g1_i3:67-1512(+)
MVKASARLRHVTKNVCRCYGSVLPAASAVAVPSAALAIVLWYVMHPDDKGGDNPQVQGFMTIWSGYTLSLGFLIVFRGNQAYSRFWEGASKVHDIRGKLYNCSSSLIAYCSSKPEMRDKVVRFQGVLVRLMSLLHGSALQQICELKDNTVELICLDGMDGESLEHLRTCRDRCEVVMQWIQRLVVDGMEQQVLNVPPPILTRSFQELSGGVVDINSVRKIKDIEFPFPYTQMMLVMLIIYSVVTPVLASQLVTAPWWAAIASFFVGAGLWALYFIAVEIDQPFGDDPNDLPILVMQEAFNQSLMCLLDSRTQNVPHFEDLNQARTGLTRISAIAKATKALHKMHSGSKQRIELDGMHKTSSDPQPLGLMTGRMSSLLSEVPQNSSKNSQRGSLLVDSADREADREEGRDDASPNASGLKKKKLARKGRRTQQEPEPFHGNHNLQVDTTDSRFQSGDERPVALDTKLAAIEPQVLGYDTGYV